MLTRGITNWRAKAATCGFLFAVSLFGFGASAQAQHDPDGKVDKIKTATPIKHVIIVVGENRSFDHLFATYVPKHESVKNLLSEGIINADGTLPFRNRGHRLALYARTGYPNY